MGCGGSTSKPYEPPSAQAAPEDAQAASPNPIAQKNDTALIEAAKARLAQNQSAIEAAVEQLSNATTGAEKKVAAAKRAELEAKSAEEQAAETAAAIDEALARGGASEMTKYDDPMAIFEALEGDATQLLRGSWVRDAPPGTVLGKRGELPPEAIITVGELREIYANSSVQHKSLPFISISHYWRSKKHPDPRGETLALIAKALKEQWPAYAKKRVTDVGIFFECAAAIISNTWVLLVCVCIPLPRLTFSLLV